MPFGFIYSVAGLCISGFCKKKKMRQVNGSL